MSVRLPSVGVILTVYKRPHLIERQLEAVRRQTIPAKEIIIWHNQEPGYDMPEIDLRPNESIIASSINRGVWARYSAMQLLDSEFIAVADDDSMPGHRFFENCLETLDQLPEFSIVGTCGVIFWDGNRHDARGVGWKFPSYDIVPADIVAHFSMFGRKLAKEFVIAHTPPFTDSCGEDYALCALARERGGAVACPPHDPQDRSGWGSLEGMPLGSDDVALWRKPGEEERKTAVHNYLRKHGWKCATEIYPQSPTEVQQ